MTPGVGSSESGEEAAEAHEEAGGADTGGLDTIKSIHFVHPILFTNPSWLRKTTAKLLYRT